jgi:hypothetical protein
MTGMSGFDLQERLAVPIIFITGHDDAQTRKRIEQSGAAGHLLGSPWTGGRCSTRSVGQSWWTPYWTKVR